MQQQQQQLTSLSVSPLSAWTSCSKNMDEKIRINRQYRKSSVPRLRWTPELHRHFVQSVHSLGGKFRATPKKILQMMGVKGLKITHVKSHLQMYRSMKDSTNFLSLHMINYRQETRPDFTTCRLPLLQVWEGGLREAAAHAKQVKFPSAKFTHQMGANLFYHHYGHQVVGTQGSSITAITKETMKLGGGASEINFMGLGQTSDQSATVTSPINLDLTMSSY